MAHPVFGRSLAIRGFDATDTPPAALGPIFSREPLLQGVKEIAEPFAGAGWLATAMRAKGITVHAGDITREAARIARPAISSTWSERPAASCSATRLTAARNPRSITPGRSDFGRLSFSCERLSYTASGGTRQFTNLGVSPVCLCSPNG